MLNEVTFELVHEYSEGSIQILRVIEGRAFLAEGRVGAKARELHGHVPTSRQKL